MSRLVELRWGALDTVTEYLDTDTLSEAEMQAALANAIRCIRKLNREVQELRKGRVN